MKSEMEGQMPTGDELLAAEYVLGVHTTEERSELARRIDGDVDFARLVNEWENHLSPFNAEFESIVPAARVKAAIDARLFAEQKAKSDGLWNSLTLWRSLTLGALALSMAVIGPNLLSPSDTLDPLVASLQADTGEIRFMAFYEPGTEEIRISKISSDKASDRDYELWLIEADGKPQSLGVIPNLESVRLSVSNDFMAKINAGDTFAVSVEPLGGSPTGEVTGPVIAAGVSNTI